MSVSSVGITVWLLSLFLMFILFLGVNSGVQCNTTSGTCTPVQVQDCSKGPHGCVTGAEQHTTILQRIESCREELSCNMRGPPYSSSRATNVSVVFIPNSDRLQTFDVTVRWDNSDDLPSGYEVLLADDHDNYIVQCACQRNATIRQVTFKKFYHDTSPYRVEVISLPYQSRSSSATVVRFKLPSPCTGLTYNQHCRGDDNHRTSTWVTAETFRIMAGDSVPPRNTGQLLLQLTMSSKGHFLVALSDSVNGSDAFSSCYTAGRDPPCFVVKNTSSVTIQPLNGSRTYYAFVESFTANACGSLGQVHNGYMCHTSNYQCCNRVKSSTATTVLPVVHTAPTLQQETGTHTDALISTVLGIHPATTTTSWHAASSVLLPSSSDVSSSTGTVGPAVGGAVGIVAAVLFFTVTVVTLCRVILWRNRREPTESKNPTLQINNVSYLSYSGPPSPEVPPPPCPPPGPSLEDFKPPLANLELQQTSSLYPPLPSPPPTPPPDPPKPKPPFARSALIIYSPLCPIKDRRILMQHLINDLMGYDIRPVAHDCDYIKGSLSEWVETEAKRASAVLCVCDPAFQLEWDQQHGADSNFPLVHSLKQLVYAHVNRGELSKYAIVLLRKKDRNCIPTDYLHNTRTFYVDEVKNIAHFVHQVPTYAFD